MLGPHTHRDNPLSRIMCAPIAPPVTVIVLHLKNLITFLFCYFFPFFSSSISFASIFSVKMKKRNDQTNTGEGGKGQRSRNASDIADPRWKSLSDTSTSARGQCVGESSTGAKSTVILDWALETCAENFPCHQCIPVSNLYAKTSGRTWMTGGSQI